MLDHLPILGICGWSGAGKTTLILQLLDLLRDSNLKTAVVKHDAHGLEVDRPGKDSSRLFAAGADVYLANIGEGFNRIHPGDNDNFLLDLQRLCCQYDLVLVEGHKRSPVPKVWLLSEGEECPPDDIPQIIRIFPRTADRFRQMAEFLALWLNARWQATPVYGCLLIGGQSSRMGRPKHLLKTAGDTGKTWCEATIETCAARVDQLVVVGKGALPAGIANVCRLPDITDAVGPLAGMISAMRWNPLVSWLVVACDLPGLHPEAIAWLLGQREIGTWGVLPRINDANPPEPLLAWYDYRCRLLLEGFILINEYRPGRLASHPRIKTPTIPQGLQNSWQNINTPAQLQNRNFF